MGLIKQSLAALICVEVLIGCASKKVGADTHEWSVTAQNGDKMVGCLAEDVNPDVLGYIDIEALPSFDITTFEELEFDVDDWMAAGKKGIRSGLVKISGTNHPLGLRDKREDKVKHCGAYPVSQDTTQWYFFQQTEKLAVEYRLFSLGQKMVFIDARTRVSTRKTSGTPNAGK